MKYKKIRPKKRKFKNNKMLYLLLLFLTIGIGYAALTTSLSINGTTNVSTNSWNIHFANLYVQSGSVESNNPTMTNNSIFYSAELAQPGDYYEFSVDVVNDGTLPGKVSLVNLIGNTTNYLSTNYSYSNGDIISVGDIINAGKSKRLTIKTWIPIDIDTSLLPTVDTAITLTFNLQYIQSEIDAPLDATDEIIALANTNSCITKYEGNVTDKVGVTEVSNNVYFNKCADKRNIIFNNMCWQMIRTTETGGIKMIYNGEIVDGKCLSTRSNHTGIAGKTARNQELNSEYLYGNTFSYNITTSEFSLIDTISATWSDSTYKNLLGKFTCKNTTGICTTLYNVNGYINATTANASSYTIGSTNYAQIGKSSFNSNYRSPAMVGYMFNKMYDSQENDAPASNSLTGNDVSYSNGTYTLLPADGESVLGTTLDDTHHYTCNTTSNTCTTVRYYYYSEDSYYVYIELDGVENIQNAINEMLYNSDVNKKNSTIKGVIDSWYNQNLSTKTNMLEDTIFCNARDMINANTNGWNKDGSINTYMNFRNFDLSPSLVCSNITDQFAVGNNKAKLTYPVGLLQEEERNNINNASLLTTNQWYWELSPGGYNDTSSFAIDILADGNDSSDYVDYAGGVRPVISLSSGNTIASGTGSETDPWIIQE